MPPLPDAAWFTGAGAAIVALLAGLVEALRRLRMVRPEVDKASAETQVTVFGVTAKTIEWQSNRITQLEVRLDAQLQQAEVLLAATRKELADLSRDYQACLRENAVLTERLRVADGRPPLRPVTEGA